MLFSLEIIEQRVILCVLCIRFVSAVVSVFVCTYMDSRKWLNAVKRRCVCDVGCIIWCDSMGEKMFLQNVECEECFYGGVPIPTVKLFYVTNIEYIIGIVCSWEIVEFFFFAGFAFICGLA